MPRTFTEQKIINNKSIQNQSKMFSLQIKFKANQKNITIVITE